MAFVKKTWEDRDSEYPNRRSLTDPITGTTEIRDIGLAEGDVYVEGTPLKASEWNDLEQRIEDAIDEIPVTEVEVTPVVTEGDTLATIRVNETSTDIKMPLPFVVNYNGFTIDKTYNEIVAAIYEGREVQLHYLDESVYELLGFLTLQSHSEICFVEMDNVIYTHGENALRLNYMLVKPDNSVESKQIQVPDLPVPNNQRFAGQILAVHPLGTRYMLTTDNTILDTSTTNTRRPWSGKKVNDELKARDNVIATKANASDVESALALKANTSDVIDALATKANSADLADVATSGNYADLNGKPTIDTAMSDSSTNAVQNRVIKAYIDEQTTDVSVQQTLTEGTEIGGITVDGVQTKLYAPTQQSEIDDTVIASDKTFSSEKISEELDGKADTDGTYEDMTVGTAMKLVTTRHTTDTAPYLFRQSGGDNNAYVGTEETDKLVGASAVVNQLVQNGNFAEDKEWSVISGSKNVSNNECVVTPLNLGSAIYQDIDISANHVVMACFMLLPSVNTIQTRARLTSGSSTVQWSSYKSVTANQKTQLVITLKPSSDCNRLYLYCDYNFASSEETYRFSKVNLIDLTAMFGTTIADYVYSLEQATSGSGIAYLRKYGFFTKDYYPYTANTLQSVNTSKHSMVGKNQCTGDLSHTGITNDRGTIATVSSRLFTSPTKVLPNTSYAINAVGEKSGENIYMNRIIEYDANGVFIRRQTTGSTIPYIYSVPSYCHYIILDLRTSSLLNIESTDISEIQIEFGSTATDYEPYSAHEYTLPNIDLRGLYKLDASNNLYADGDTLEGDGTLARKYEQRPYQSGDESLTDAITDGTNTVVKLATPTTEQVTGFTNPQIVSKDGTEEYVDNRDMPLPVGHETDYPLDSEMALPVPPVTAGTYNLQLTVDASGNQTYAWAT